MTPEEREDQRQKKQAEENRYREILFAFRIRPLTTDEWELLESKPFHKGLFGKLGIEEELQYGDTPKDIQHALRQRATDYIQEYARDRYPSWWEVYDENGKHISRMSPQHKASLAEMRRFNNLSPEEKYKWLCEIREQSDNYLRSAGFKETTAGEKFAEVIEGFFAFLLALFRSPEDNDQPAPQPA